MAATSANTSFLFVLGFEVRRLPYAFGTVVTRCGDSSQLVPFNTAQLGRDMDDRSVYCGIGGLLFFLWILAECRRY